MVPTKNNWVSVQCEGYGVTLVQQYKMLPDVTINGDFLLNLSWDFDFDKQCVKTIPCHENVGKKKNYVAES